MGTVGASGTEVTERGFSCFKAPIDLRGCIRASGIWGTCSIGGADEQLTPPLRHDAIRVEYVSSSLDGVMICSLDGDGGLDVLSDYLGDLLDDYLVMGDNPIRNKGLLLRAIQLTYLLPRPEARPRHHHGEDRAAYQRP